MNNNKIDYKNRYRTRLSDQNPDLLEKIITFLTSIKKEVQSASEYQQFKSIFQSKILQQQHPQSHHVLFYGQAPLTPTLLYQSNAKAEQSAS